MFQIDLASRTPIYEQLVQNIVRLASAGVIKSGDKLPPVRALAGQLGINPNTAAKAYRMLESEGYIYTVVGSGSFMSDKLQNSALKMVAVNEFMSATKKAQIYGATKEELTGIINNTFEGGGK